MHWATSACLARSRNAVSVSYDGQQDSAASILRVHEDLHGPRPKQNRGSGLHQEHVKGSLKDGFKGNFKGTPLLHRGPRRCGPGNEAGEHSERLLYVHRALCPVQCLQNFEGREMAVNPAKLILGCLLAGS